MVSFYRCRPESCLTPGEQGRQITPLMGSHKGSHKVIYPGSFDPPTNGHISLIHRALKMFDQVVVAIAHNPKKTPMFSVEERSALILEAIGRDPGVEVDSFEGLLVDYARRRQIPLIMRGLRAVSDFEYEFQMANMNRKLDKGIETVFVMTGEDYFYISSQIVREVASLGGDVSGLVPPNVFAELKKRFVK
jgi:pantetheine-phosphate adenylyltransferase